MQDTTFVAPLFLSALILAGCDSKPEPSSEAPPAGSVAAAASGAAPAPTPASAPPSSRTFDKEIRKKTCELLTADAVAKVAGVGARKIEQRELMGGTMCMYTWKGGQAQLAFIRVGKTAKARRSRFDREHQNKTGAEVANDMQKVMKGVEKRNQTAKTKVDLNTAKLVGRTATKALAAGFDYEKVDGLGDAAVLDVTRRVVKVGGIENISYGNKLAVLVGNMSFDVSYMLEVREGKIYRRENVALAKAVLANLGS